MIDLRKETELILGDFGHPILLQRSSRKIRCSCWNELYQEADSKCVLCNGIGWLVRIEKHLARRQDASVAVTRPNRVQDTLVGDVMTGANMFFVQHHVHPAVQDIIYEIGWDAKNNPINIISVHEINSVEPERGQRGRIEYYRVHTRLSGVNFIVKQIRPRKIGQETVYEFVHKGAER